MSAAPHRELRIGEDVLGPDGHPLGQVERLVVDERAHRVTHVVVDGRLVGVQRLRDAGRDGLVADLSADDLKRLPEAEHDHIGAPGANWSAPLGYTLENFLAIAGALVGQAPYQPPVHLDTELEDVHEVTAGSPVWSGRRRVGDVERVLADDAGAVSELVVRLHGPFGRHVRVPIDRVTEVVGNNVHVDLDEAAERELADFRDEG